VASRILLLLAQLAAPSPTEAPKPPEAPAAVVAPVAPPPTAPTPTVAVPAAPPEDHREGAVPASAPLEPRREAAPAGEPQGPRAATKAPLSDEPPPPARKPGERPRDVTRAREIPPLNPGDEPPPARKPSERPRDVTAAREIPPLNPGDEPPPPGPVLPPSLTQHALCEELQRSTLDRRSTYSKMEADRARLERLAAEVAEARAALKQETARLEALVRKAGPGRVGGPAAGAVPLLPVGSERAPVETLARTIRGMQPEQAAAVLARLDPHLAVAVLRRIRPADAGAIADKLKPDTAAALFALLASAAPPVPKEAR
jgi:flagellar motility protein MotE (MotC chaperone)